jgi:hypothetical protein
VLAKRWTLHVLVPAGNPAHPLLEVLLGSPASSSSNRPISYRGGMEEENSVVKYHSLVKLASDKRRATTTSLVTRAATARGGGFNTLAINLSNTGDENSSKRRLCPMLKPRLLKNKCRSPYFGSCCWRPCAESWLDGLVPHTHTPRPLFKCSAVVDGLRLCG